MGYTVLTGQFGATLGKPAIGARIVTVDGTPIGFGRAFSGGQRPSLPATVGRGFLP
jgi:hypothetical protein